MIISPFTPLFFKSRKTDGIASRHTQLFAPSDHILVEVLASPSEQVTLAVNDECGGTAFPMQMQTEDINASTRLHYSVLSGLSEGFYSVTIGESRSNLFRVTSDEGILSRTTLIQYGNPDNTRRTDARFIVAGQRRFFDFRVPGGFKDSGWTFAVENEQFTTQEGDPVELFAVESVQKRLTVGWQEGVPVEFAELLNRLLTCSHVYLDGVRYARKGSSVPELAVQIDGLDSFVVSQSLQQVCNLDPSIENFILPLIRRVSDNTFRAAVNNDTEIINRTIY